jgi:hypothetical protein
MLLAGVAPNSYTVPALLKKVQNKEQLNFIGQLIKDNNMQLNDYAIKFLEFTENKFRTK